MQQFHVEVDDRYHRPLAFAPDGRLLVVAAKGFARLDTADGTVRLYPEANNSKGSFALVRDGAAVAYRNTGLRVLDLTTGQVEGRPGGDGPPLQALTSAGAGGVCVSDRSFAGASAVKLLNDDLTERATVAALSDWVDRLATSADGRWVTGGSTGVVRVWGAVGEEPFRQTMRAEWSGPSFAFALSAAGERLVVATNRSVAGWDARTGEEMFRNGKLGRKMRAVACSPTRPLFATGGEDGAVSLWDHGGRVLTRYDWGLAGGVRGLAFSPDGLRGAASGGDGTVVVWDVDA